jgi:hypothetical protein
MTNPDTDTLKALLEKATPGPWACAGNGITDRWLVTENEKAKGRGRVLWRLAVLERPSLSDYLLDEFLANADLIAHAPHPRRRNHHPARKGE